MKFEYSKFFGSQIFASVLTRYILENYIYYIVTCAFTIPGYGLNNEAWVGEVL